MLTCLLPLSALRRWAASYARHRGELVDICNQIGLTGNAAEVGVFRAGFSQHNLQRWKGSKYYMIDAWAHRANDTGSTDKNRRRSRGTNRITGGRSRTWRRGGRRGVSAQWW